MLIHVSRFTAIQATVVNQVAAYVQDLKGRYSRSIDLTAIENLMRREYEDLFLPGMEATRNSDIYGFWSGRPDFDTNNQMGPKCLKW